MKEGLLKKQSPDKSRAEFLIQEAKQNYSYLKELIQKIGVHDKNANNFVKDCYDILMGLIRLEILLKGYNASGFGAHESEISYMGELKFTENEIQFADKIRYFRNGMLYYGTILDKEYAQKVIDFTKKFYKKLAR